jgi:hypothetical protein
MRVYHFTSLDSARKILAGKRLKISRLEDLNDPYELLGADLSDDELRAAYLKVRENFAANRGVLCFCRSFELPIMWSLYADRHRGVCLAFDIPDTHAFSVLYADDRVSFVKDMLGTHDAEKHMERFLGTKHSAWEHEDEVRLFSALEEAEGGMYFQDLGTDVKLAEVLAGVRCSALEVEELRTLANGVDPAVTVSRTKLSDRAFKVERE